MNFGKILVFSAPSGAGKTTIVKHLVSTFPNLSFSISATTRPKRPEETDGKDYYFLSETAFRKKLQQQEFIEYEEVYKGVFYGTLKSEIERIRQEGKHVVLDVDVQGGLHLKEYYGKSALAVFVQPPSIEALAQRLAQRNTETQSTLNERIAKAEHELSFANQFDVVLLNDSLDKAFTTAEELVMRFVGADSHVL